MKQNNKLKYFLREIVYGAADGIVTTFAVVAGFSGAGSDGSQIAGLSASAVLLFGFANLFADATSMGLGNFLGIRAEKDVYQKGKANLIFRAKQNPNESEEMIKGMLAENGYNSTEAADLASRLILSYDFTSKLILDYVEETPNPVSINPFTRSVITSISFILFGFIPLTPYIFLKESSNNFAISISATSVALLLLGILRWQVSKNKLFRSVFETLIIGGISALIAYLVGTLF